MRTLIIGIGNPFRGDDGLGWDVAGELSSELRREDVQVLATHQLTPELSDLVSRAEPHRWGANFCYQFLLPYSLKRRDLVRHLVQQISGSVE